MKRDAESLRAPVHATYFSISSRGFLVASVLFVARKEPQTKLAQGET